MDDLNVRFLVELLAERYVSEMENPGEVPCLLDLLVRVGA